MFASDLTIDHVGQDLTITIGSRRVGGVIRSVGRNPLFGTVAVDLDGLTYNLEPGKPVELNSADTVPYTDLYADAR